MYKYPSRSWLPLRSFMHSPKAELPRPRLMLRLTFRGPAVAFSPSGGLVLHSHRQHARAPTPHILAHACAFTVFCISRPSGCEVLNSVSKQGERGAAKRGRSGCTVRRLALSHGAQASSVAVGAEEGPRCSVGVGSRGESTRRALRVETVRRV